MECANPSYIKDGIVYHWSNPIDSKGNLIFPAQRIDCRWCDHCRSNRSRELADCCELESTSYMYKNNHFLTFTKRPSYEKISPVFNLKEIKSCIKRIQRWCYSKHACTPMIYRVHEHGKKGRSHYHLIVYNLPLWDIVPTKDPLVNDSLTIRTLWGHGHITVQDLNEATAMYQSMYLDKDLKNGHANSSKRSISWHSGIGKRAFLKNYKQWFNLGYIPRPGGRKMKIPRKFMRQAQKHIDAITLTNEQFCWKYSKENTKKIILGQKTKLCNITINVNYEMAELYAAFKQKERNEERNNERMKQITEYIMLHRKLKPDFHLSGENTVYNKRNRLKEARL